MSEGKSEGYRLFRGQRGKVPEGIKPGGTFFFCNEANGETSKDDKWTGKIGGMTIYNSAQILTALNQAGFSDAQVNKNSKGWICVTAKK